MEGMREEGVGGPGTACGQESSLRMAAGWTNWTGRQTPPPTPLGQGSHKSMGIKGIKHLFVCVCVCV